MEDHYIAISVGPDRRPAILVASPGGATRALDLSGLPATVAKLDNPLAGDARFWDSILLRSFTVTAMQWHDGKLYVAGLTNGIFASSLRILGTPFGGSQAVTSIAMYHTTHNQMEKRADRYPASVNNPTLSSVRRPEEACLGNRGQPQRCSIPEIAPAYVFHDVCDRYKPL